MLSPVHCGGTVPWLLFTKYKCHMDGKPSADTKEPVISLPVCSTDPRKGRKTAPPLLSRVFTTFCNKTTLNQVCPACFQGEYPKKMARHRGTSSEVLAHPRQRMRALTLYLRSMHAFLSWEGRCHPLQLHRPTTGEPAPSRQALRQQKDVLWPDSLV